MRDFKFRAFHKPSKKWWTHEETLSVFMIMGRVADGTADDKGFLDKVVAEQYTGLKDENGKEIYEGDIVNSDFPEDGACYAVIIFEDGAFRKQYKDWDNTLSKPIITSVEIDILKLVVVGNVHENQDLC